MDLNEEQKSAVKGWVEAGAELGEIQSRLKEEFDLSLTYLDTRFLPAFVASEAYAVFVRERFPGRGQKRVPVPRGEVLVAPAAVSTCAIS